MVSRSMFSHAPGGTRTPNLLIRSQMLYPIELRAPTPRLLVDAHLQTARIRNQTHSTIRYGRYKTRTCDLHDVNVAL